MSKESRHEQILQSSGCCPGGFASADSSRLLNLGHDATAVAAVVKPPAPSVEAYSAQQPVFKHEVGEGDAEGLLSHVLSLSAQCLRRRAIR